MKKFFNVEEYNNIKELITASVNKYKNKPAFVIKHKQDDQVEYENISYNQMLNDINGLGTAFYSMGLKGKRVAIIGKNRYEWFLTHLTNLFGSIISIPLDKDLQLEELESSLIRSEANVIVFDDKLSDLIENIKFRGNTLISNYICMSDKKGYKSILELIKHGNELISKGDNSFIENKINNDELSVLLFTSGTTSKSKAVMLSQKNFASNIYALQSVEDIRPTDTNIALLPFHHVFGSACMIMMLASGAKTVFTDGLRYIKQNMCEYQVSLFVGVPLLIESMYNAITKEIAKQGKTNLINTMRTLSNALLKIHIDLRRVFFKKILDNFGGKLRLVISGGAPADANATIGFHDFGVEVLQGYGLSETAPVIAAESYFNKKIGTVGKPMRNVQVEVVNCDSDGIGEIRAKGPNIMLGYYGMEDLTNEVLQDGWFYTGDLGYFDEEGFLYVTGRSKNLIVLKNGKKVFPEELETVVNRLDLVSECMVFGLQDKEDINDVTISIKAVFDEEIVKQKYNNYSEEELKNILWDKLKEINLTFPRYKHIQKLITSHTELIKTTTKKVKRQEEMKLIMQGGI